MWKVNTVEGTDPKIMTLLPVSSDDGDKELLSHISPFSATWSMSESIIVLLNVKGKLMWWILMCVIQLYIFFSLTTVQ